MRVAQEEIFGPVAPIFLADSEMDALNITNDSQYGLGAYWNLLTCRQLDFMMSWFTNTMWNRKIGTENNACSQ
jgi:acyl-CoA reductase-like NAD-dependent aldehyde dehydrogenase